MINCALNYLGKSDKVLSYIAGLLYKSRNKPEQDMIECISFYKKSAEQGNSMSLWW